MGTGKIVGQDFNQGGVGLPFHGRGRNQHLVGSVGQYEDFFFFGVRFDRHLNFHGTYPNIFPFMALYTKLSRSQIVRLASLFDLPPPKKIRGVLEGTVNTFYALSYPGQIYFLKIDEVGSRTRLDREITVFKRLQKIKSRLGFDVPLPLKAKNGKYFVPFKNRFALIFTEVADRPAIKPNARQLVAMGGALGALHRATHKIPLPPHRFHLQEQERIYRQIGRQLKKRYPTVYKQEAFTLAWLKANRPAGIPQGLIHGDLFPENIHFKEGRLQGIVDFESAGSGEFLFDIAAALHACCHDGRRFSIPKSKALLKGYARSRPLSLREQKRLGYFLVYAANRFLLTRLRDFALKKGKIATKTYRDFREYFRRFDEIPEFTRALG